MSRMPPADAAEGEFLRRVVGADRAAPSSAAQLAFHEARLLRPDSTGLPPVGTPKGVGAAPGRSLLTKLGGAPWLLGGGALLGAAAVAGALVGSPKGETNVLALVTPLEPSVSTSEQPSAPPAPHALQRESERAPQGQSGDPTSMDPERREGLSVAGTAAPPAEPSVRTSSTARGPREPRVAQRVGTPKRAGWSEAAEAMRAGGGDDARGALQQLVDTSAGTEREAAALTLAQVELRQGQIDRARARLRSLAEHSKDELVRERASRLLRRLEKGASR